MKKELWTLDMPYEAFRSAIGQIVAAENAGLPLGRVTFDTKTKIISIGVEGTEPKMDV